MTDVRRFVTPNGKHYVVRPHARGRGFDIFRDDGAASHRLGKVEDASAPVLKLAEYRYLSEADRAVYLRLALDAFHGGAS